MASATPTGWLHLTWIEFCSQPIVGYLSNPLSLEGAVLPALVSLFITIKKLGDLEEKRTVFGFLLFSIAIAFLLNYWGTLGLHLFPVSLIVWPTMSLLQGGGFPWPIAYPLAFLSTVIPDLFGAGMANHWDSTWFFGVGGAGFQDGLFVFPLETLLLSWVASKIGATLRHFQILTSGPNER